MKAKRSSAVIGVVDDDESVRLGLSSVLRSADWRVVVYSSGDELLGDARRSTLNLVIADIQMPGTDGFGLLKTIKLWSRPVPVICITAYATDDVFTRANNDGAAGFLQKPIDIERLLAVVDQILK